ncbi:MAG: hypothetical protein FWF10_10340 [Clostridiales bacterium]|nr:hypothetical protein [Clostridiales bacterium]
MRYTNLSNKAKHKTIAWLLLCCLLCTACTVPTYLQSEDEKTGALIAQETPNAPIEKATDYALYESILKKVHDEYNDEYLTYCVYDLDGDGIAELIVLEGTCEADYAWMVYTIADHAVQYVDWFSGAHSALYVRAEGGIYNMQGHMSIERLTEVTMENGEIVKNKLYETDVGEAGYNDPPGNQPLDWAYITDYRLINP